MICLCLAFMSLPGVARLCLGRLWACRSRGAAHKPITSKGLSGRWQIHCSLVWGIRLAHGRGVGRLRCRTCALAWTCRQAAFLGAGPMTSLTASTGLRPCSPFDIPRSPIEFGRRNHTRHLETWIQDCLKAKSPKHCRDNTPRCLKCWEVFFMGHDYGRLYA